MGVWHEQSRPDRDQYVTINEGNIAEGRAGNFNKYTTNSVDSLGIQYDYSSVMHYGRTAFSTGGETITPTDDTAVIGQRNGPSVSDILQVRLLYKCDTPRTLATFCSADCLCQQVNNNNNNNI